uniref:C2H2-type domain-containing protein n=1 Tax=Caenorhabditis tropicalis TaxID=1561998 RepID=A0A1I7TBF9_9PELO
MDNQRKRQLKMSSNEEFSTAKKPTNVKLEPIDDFEKEIPAASSQSDSLFNHFDSIATSHHHNKEFNTFCSRQSQYQLFDAFQLVHSKKNQWHICLSAAFRQFLNGYIQAGGDANLANTFATYAAALPMPPHPLKPLTSISPLKPTVPEDAPQNSPKQLSTIPIIKTEPPPESEPMESSNPVKPVTLSCALGEDDRETKDSCPTSSDSAIPPVSEMKSALLPLIPRFSDLPLTSSRPIPETASEIQRLREAAFGRYKNVLCVICNEWICSRNRKNHIEAHLNYRPYKCSACNYARRREIFVMQHIKSQHQGQEGVEMLSQIDLHVALEVDRLADECVTRTRKLIENMQEKKDGDFGENKDFDEKALELMIAEEAEKKVVVIESVSEVRAKVANYHRRQRTKVLKKIYDTDAAKQAELKIVKDEEGCVPMASFKLEEGFEIKLEDLMKMVEAGDTSMEVDGAGPSETTEDTAIAH